MGWIFTIILSYVAILTGDTDLWIAAGLFAIAGSIGLKILK